MILSTMLFSQISPSIDGSQQYPEPDLSTDYILDMRKVMKYQAPLSVSLEAEGAGGRGLCRQRH